MRQLRSAPRCSSSQRAVRTAPSVVGQARMPQAQGPRCRRRGAARGSGGPRPSRRARPASRAPGPDPSCRTAGPGIAYACPVVAQRDGLVRPSLVATANASTRSCGPGHRPQRGAPARGVGPHDGRRRVRRGGFLLAADGTATGPRARASPALSAGRARCRPAADLPLYPVESLGAMSSRATPSAESGIARRRRFRHVKSL